MVLHKLYKVKIKKKELLSKKGSLKQVYHIILDISNTDLSFNPGDCAAIIPKNDPKIVDLCIQYMKANASDKIYYERQKKEYSFKIFLENCVNISKINSKIINILIQKIKDPIRKKKYEDFFSSKENMRNYLQNHELWDILKEFQIKINPQEIANHLRPILPRLYSIASYENFYKNEIHLIVSYLCYETSNILRHGVASHFLCTSKEKFINLYIQPTHKFSLPKKKAKIIMIGTGTGMAPFVAFMQKRFLENFKENSLLFFGEQKKEKNFYFQNFWEKLEKENFLKLKTAFSRDQKEKIYVQHRILENSKEIWNFINQGAYIYICGSAQRMGKDVDEAFKKIFEKEGVNPSLYLSKLIEENRYLKDVY